jgi:acetyltransferase-like isoleucine patch superfamily enzyme
MMFKTFFHKLEKRFHVLGRMARRIFRGEEISGLRQTIKGQGNMLETEGVLLSGVELDIAGDHNQIVIGEGSALYNLKIRIRGSDHRIELGRNCRVTRGGVFWIEDNHCLLRIGQNTTMVEAAIAVTEPGSKVIIGEDCMFANDIDIRVGDSHSVIDAASGKRINFAENITIGNHVWIAAHTVILKGVIIGENSVVASGAVVTKSCEPGIILAGNPARTIKTGINWKRERILKSE